jgi:hypothetical protein
MASQRPAQQSGSVPAPQQPPTRPVAAAPAKPPAMDAAASQPKMGDAKPQGQRPPRQPRGERRENSRSDNQDNNMAEQRNQQQRMQGPPPNKFSDAHQLFVGNLPHNIEENELKEFFEKGIYLKFKSNPLYCDRTLEWKKSGTS